MPTQRELEDLYREHRDRMFDVLRKRGATAAEADDLIQEIFCSVLARRALTPIAKFRNYLFVAASRAVAGLRRAQAIRAAKLIANSPLTVERSDGVGAHRIDTVLEGQEQVSEVVALLKTLSLTEQRILVRSKVQGLPAREIARIMKMDQRRVETILTDLNARIENAINGSSQGRTRQ